LKAGWIYQFLEETKMEKAQRRVIKYNNMFAPRAIWIKVMLFVIIFLLFIDLIFNLGFCVEERYIP